MFRRNWTGLCPRRSTTSALTELQAFQILDPLLARLHKEYLDAKDHRAKAIKDFGQDDPMTDMAMLVEDSAWCAMQARYMELRADRVLMAKAQTLMKSCALIQAYCPDKERRHRVTKFSLH